MQAFDGIASNQYGASARKVQNRNVRISENEIKWLTLIVTGENRTKHNPSWPYVSDHSHRILICDASTSDQINALLT